MPHPRVLRRTAAISLAAALGLVATACSADKADTAAPGKPADLALTDTTGTAVGAVENLRWLLAKEPKSLDLDLRSDTNSNIVLANVCERLFQTQPDLSARPHLAESATYTDPTTLVLKLRTDVTFHDGSPMTVDDVVWSLQRHAAEGGNESDEFERVASVAKSGDAEVTVKLKEPDALFLKALAGNAGVVLDREQTEAAGKDYGTPGRADACSGPYKVAGWQAGSKLTLDRYDAYWDKAVKPLTRSATFTWAEENAMVNSLTTGAADGTYLTSMNAVPPLAANGQLTVAYGNSTRAWALIPTERGGMQDPRLRRALSLALDRAGIAKSGFNGLATPWKTPLGPGAWGYEKQAFQAAYEALTGAPAQPTEAELAEAKRLVAEVGGSAPTIVVANDGTPTRNLIANAVVDAARKIGLKAEIKTMSGSDFSSLYSDVGLRKQVDLVADDWYISKSDPAGFYDNAVTGSSNNWIGYSSPEYDRVVGEALRTIDDPARARLLVEAERMFTADAVWLPLVQVPNTLVVNAKFTGAPASMANVAYPWLAHVGTKA
ncbi:ABC transporter substrate-binding protein [Streptodolium elevatio]|uniref:ABC transporter substrate-binding protein n=1 Tax=Streptodolium elevatio TaxID=3157996 RepID=A0ABV3DP80_9ACTN